ncbi:MAG: response regulator [Verrucomicrobiales bacterium]|nr:response regulator [Verrucomicrobiales bacterium]
MGTNQQIDILLVEDSAAQALLVKTLLKPPWRVMEVASDGNMAMRFLNKEEEFSGVSKPHLILLDINMPHKNGFEVLAEIKENPDLKHIPVVMFTTSDEKKDIEKAYDGGASSYIEKPPSIDELESILDDLVEYWSKTSKLPVTVG